MSDEVTLELLVEEAKALFEAKRSAWDEDRDDEERMMEIATEVAGMATSGLSAHCLLELAANNLDEFGTRFSVSPAMAARQGRFSYVMNRLHSTWKAEQENGEPV